MIYFLIPVYNEEANIPELAKNLTSLQLGELKHFVFVNDGSTDKTAQQIEECFTGNAFTLLHNHRNSGPGFSFNEGFKFVLSSSTNSNDLVVTLESDNTSDLSILPMMLNLASQWDYDLVLASVYAQGGGFSSTSFIRKIISLVSNQILRFVYDIKVLTLSSFYRTYKISILTKVSERYGSIIDEKGFICALELLLKAIRLNAKIIEVPMVLRSDKRKGKSKMKIVKTSLSYIKFLLQKKI